MLIVWPRSDLLRRPMPWGRGAGARSTGTLRDRRVVILLDNDDEGRKRGGVVSGALNRIATEIRVVELPGLPLKGDVSDWLNAGNTVDDLKLIIRETPVWVPGDDDDKTDRSTFVTSGTRLDDEDEPEWPVRQELPAKSSEVPSLPAEMIPVRLRTWLTDIANRVAIPLEMVAVPAMVGLGAVVGRTLSIRPSRFDDYVVVPNLWGAVVARPGFMKSHAIGEALKPLGQLARTSHERFLSESDLAEAKRARIRAEIDALQTELKQSVKRGDDATGLEVSIAMKQAQLRDSDIHERRYLTHDVTVEKLGELLKDNPRGLLLLRDELAGWLQILSRPGREGEREFYLEAWNGTGSYTVDRIGRGTLHIPSLTLSIIGGIQPGKLHFYIAGAMSGGAGDDGLLQRFQLLVWPDGLGPWQMPTDWPDRRAKVAVVELFKALDQIDSSSVGAVTDDDEVPYLRFSPGAQHVYDLWRDVLERRLRSDDLSHTPSFASHIAKYRSLMPALALVFHLVETAGQEHCGLVSEFAARLAAEWCAYLELHARKVYREELNRSVSAAHLLAKRIESGEFLDGQTRRDIYRRNWKGLNSPESVRVGLDELVAASWVRVEKLQTDGRPKEIIRLHPELRGSFNV